MWNVVVVLNRETVASALKTLAALDAAATQSTQVDLLVNGNPPLAQDLAAALRDAPSRLHSLRVWSIRCGDKAHAWNEYIRAVWPGHGTAFFVDGYVRVDPGAFERLAEALAPSPQRLAATGVPCMGRSAASLRAQMLREGGLHGNLFAVREDAMARLRALRFRLPLGLYRVDSTLGAAFAFGLDPSTHAWAPLQHVAVVPAATWAIDTDTSSPWQRLRTQLKRRMRQAQGQLENRAVRSVWAVARQPLGSLPATVDALVDGWARGSPADLRRVLRRDPLSALALRRVRVARDWSAAAEAPQLLLAQGV